MNMIGRQAGGRGETTTIAVGEEAGIGGCWSAQTGNNSAGRRVGLLLGWQHSNMDDGMKARAKRLVVMVTTEEIEEADEVMVVLLLSLCA